MQKIGRVFLLLCLLIILGGVAVGLWRGLWYGNILIALGMISLVGLLLLMTYVLIILNRLS
jgi:hypothetical protein